MDKVQVSPDPFSPVEISNSDGASAVIYPYGAHVASWKVASGKEWIFLSEKAIFRQGAAIRGGVPIIFPQFNAFGSGPRHGFARNKCWSPVDLGNTTNECVFSLESDDDTLSLWPHSFLAKFHVKLIGDRIEMTLLIENTGVKAFTFTCALHTYFAVSDFSKSKIEGLNGLSYWDNDGSPFFERKIQNDSVLSFSDAIDRVYFSSEKPLRLVDGDDVLSISSTGFNDVVVWNPGVDAAMSMSDFGNNEYASMVCIEAASIDTPVILEAGASWKATQTLEAL